MVNEATSGKVKITKQDESINAGDGVYWFAALDDGNSKGDRDESGPRENIFKLRLA
jgi:hypothetical protein